MATDSTSTERGNRTSSERGDERADSAGRSRSTRRDDSDRDDPYVVRPYEASDRDGYLELYDMVLGDRDDEWFRWKYEDNPYADHVPIVLATHDGDVVGAKPCFALELRAAERTVVGYQPADVVVHPDHRRRGLYSRTTERMKERYADREPALFFNFPNEATLSGSLKHGWDVVEEVPTYYRIQRPAAILDANGGGRFTAILGATRSVVQGYLRARETFTRAPADVVVRRYDDVPSETLVGLYERAIPRTLHAHRDETFYEWRFDNPKWRYDAYVASRHGTPIAGVVTGSQLRDGARYTFLTDVVPLADVDGRADGLRAILARIRTERRDADVIAVSGRTIDSDLLKRFGFHSDASPPLSRVANPTTQVTYPIADDGGHPWTVAGLAVADPANWTVTFAEQDTS